ncbi:MAG TPA: YdeI/OmpD-associated family protein [Actinomycetota bacterium]|nr:YdeI/OmpD-associated family protein [Actinomycetota bacterium]
MSEPEIVAPRDRADWRRWLAAHHGRPTGVWLLIKKKGSDATGVAYEDAAQEALCFGWIDGKANRHDDDHYRLWLSPRKPNSMWSAVNKQRVADLTAHGLIEPPGQAVIDRARANGSWDALNASDALEVPDDLAAALDAHPPARRHWDAFPPSARKNILVWIGSAKREETRTKRIARTAELAAQDVRANQPGA